MERCAFIPLQPIGPRQCPASFLNTPLIYKRTGHQSFPERFAAYLKEYRSYPQFYLNDPTYSMPFRVRQDCVCKYNEEVHKGNEFPNPARCRR